MARRATATLATGLGLAVSVCATASAENWTTYRNERYGVTVEYPDRFSNRDTPPENGDGQSFKTSDGRAGLTVSSTRNTTAETPRQMMEARRPAGVRTSLAAADATGYALSWAKDGRVSYIRCRLSEREHEVVGCLDLEYPEGELRAWDAVVTRISRSLRF